MSWYIFTWAGSITPTRTVLAGHSTAEDGKTGNTIASTSLGSTSGPLDISHHKASDGRGESELAAAIKWTPPRCWHLPFASCAKLGLWNLWFAASKRAAKHIGNLQRLCGAMLLCLAERD
eukprot:3276383-Amphidinium_carterae.2